MHGKYAVILICRHVKMDAKIMPKNFNTKYINSSTIFILEIFNFSIKLAQIWTDNTYQNELKPIKQKER